MKAIIAIVFAVGLISAAPSVRAADDGSVSARPSDVDLRQSGGVGRFFLQLELTGGSGS